MNIKITKHELFFYLRIYFFIFENEIVKFKKFVIFYFENGTFPKFNDSENSMIRKNYQIF